MKVTASTARIHTWLDIFIGQRRYVVITFTDDGRLVGLPEHLTNDTTEGLLYVSDPAWIGKMTMNIRISTFTARF